MKIILASTSPRRRELLQMVGFKPEIVAPGIDESMKENESAPDFLRRITLEKGRSVQPEKYPGALVISADTVVVLENRLIGKPESRDHARQILRDLSHQTHEVWTGVACFFKNREFYDRSVTRVTFSRLSDQEIENYLDCEHYEDKAGAYAIQGRAAVFVERIAGCYFNVMGFPLNMFYGMCQTMGVPGIIDSVSGGNGACP